MRVSRCRINLGGGEHNRNMAIDVSYFVDVFVFLDCTVTREAELVDHTNDVHELVSCRMNSGVEVFLRRCLVRWWTVEWHDC